MEEIEYLEEYEDLIMPQAFTSSNDFSNEGLSLDILDQPTEHLEIFNSVTTETDALNSFPESDTPDSNSRSLFQIISSEIIQKPLAITSGNTDSLTNESLSNKSSSLQITPYEHEISNLSFLNRITSKTFPTNYTVQRLDKLKSVATVKPTLQRNIPPIKQIIECSSPPLKKPYQLSPLIGSSALSDPNIKNASDPKIDVLVSKTSLEDDTFLDFNVDKNGCVSFDFETDLGTEAISDICTETLNYEYGTDNFNLETYISPDSSLTKNKLKRENLHDSNVEVSRKRYKIVSDKNLPQKRIPSDETKSQSKHSKISSKKIAEKKLGLKKKLDKSRLVFKKNGKKIIIADKSRFSFKSQKKQKNSVDDDEKNIEKPTEDVPPTENLNCEDQPIENDTDFVSKSPCSPSPSARIPEDVSPEKQESIEEQPNNKEEEVVTNSDASSENTSTNNVPEDKIKVIFSSPNNIKSSLSKSNFEQSLPKDITIDQDKSPTTSFGLFSSKSLKSSKLNDSFPTHLSNEENTTEQNVSDQLSSTPVCQMKTDEPKDVARITKTSTLEKKSVIAKEVTYGESFKIGAVDVKKINASSSNASRKSEVAEKNRSNEPVSNQSTKELQVNLVNKSVEQSYSFVEKCNKEEPVVVEKENNKPDDSESSSNKSLDKNENKDDDNECSSKRTQPIVSEVTVFSTEKPLNTKRRRNDEKLSLPAKTNAVESEKIAFSIKPSDKSVHKNDEVENISKPKATEVKTYLMKRKSLSKPEHKNDEKGSPSSGTQSKASEITISSTTDRPFDANANIHKNEEKGISPKPVEKIDLSICSTKRPLEKTIGHKKDEEISSLRGLSKGTEISACSTAEKPNDTNTHNEEKDNLSPRMASKNSEMSKTTPTKKQMYDKLIDKGFWKPVNKVPKKKGWPTPVCQIGPCPHIKLNKHTVDKLIKSGKVRLHTPTPLFFKNSKQSKTSSVPALSHTPPDTRNQTSKKLAEMKMVANKKRKKIGPKKSTRSSQSGKNSLSKDNESTSNCIATNSQCNLSSEISPCVVETTTAPTSAGETANESTVKNSTFLSSPKTTDSFVLNTRRRSSMKLLLESAGNITSPEKCTTNENDSKKENCKKSADQQKDLETETTENSAKEQTGCSPMRKLRNPKKDPVTRLTRRKREWKEKEKDEQVPTMPVLFPQIDSNSNENEEPPTKAPPPEEASSILIPTVPITAEITPALPTQTVPAQATLVDPTPVDPSPSKHPSTVPTTAGLTPDLPIPLLPSPTQPLPMPVLPTTAEIRPEIPTNNYVPAENLSLLKTSPNCFTGISLIEPKQEINTDNVTQLCNTNQSISNMLIESTTIYNGSQQNVDFLRRSLANQSCSNSCLPHDNNLNFALFELPAYIVLKTKIISREDLPQNKNAAPTVDKEKQIGKSSQEDNQENIVIKTERPEFKKICAEINELIGENANYLKFASASDRQARMNGVLADFSLSVDDAQCTLKFLQSFLSTDRRDKTTTAKGQQFIPIYDSRKHIIGYRKRTTRPSKSASSSVSKESSRRLLSLRSSLKSNAPTPAPAPVSATSPQTDLVFSTKKEPDLDVADSEVIVPDVAPENEHCIKTEVGHTEEEAIISKK